MTESKGSHPSLEQLAAFDRGHLPPAEWAEVEGHVCHCDACCRRLEALPDEDALVALMRESVAEDGGRAGPGSRDTGTWAEGSANTPAPAAAARPEVPPELAAHPRYRILGFVGAGGMGTVYKAEHRLMERVVALKVIRRDLTDRPGAVERFRQEARAAARLAHPNIVLAHDAEQAGDVHFLVMEFVEGASLDRLVRQGGALPVADACRLAEQAARGLQHALDKGMVHRDIKPANLLLTPEGQVKILDFGLARFASENPPAGPLTPSGTVIGTPDYIAPEQALDARQADIRADIYSLGCTLYFLLAGQPPFPGGTALQKLVCHREQPPRPLAELRPGLPPGLEQVLQRMLAKDPRQRYQTPAEVAEDLGAFVRAAPAPRLETGSRRALRPGSGGRASRRVALAIALLLAAAGLTAAAGVVAWQVIRARRGADSGQVTGSPAALNPGEVRRCVSATGPFSSVAFSPDGRQALAAGADNALQLWDLEGGNELGRLKGHTDTVLTISFSPDGLRALSAGVDQAVCVWDLREQRLLRHLEGHTGWVRSVTFGGDGRHALSAGDDGRLLLWDTQQAQPKREVKDQPYAIGCLQLDALGRFALTGCSDNQLRLWDLEAKQPLLRSYVGHTRAVLCEADSRDNRYFLSGSADHTARLWRAYTDRQLCRFEGHAAEVSCVALSPDNHWALTGSADRTVRLWDAGSGKEVARFEGHADKVLGVAFSADGRQAVSGGKDGTLRVWQLPEGLESTPAGYLERFTAVALSPDGSLEAMSIGDERVRVYDIVHADGRAKIQERGALHKHTDTVLTVAFAPDGKTLASGGWDTTIRLWDVAGGEEVKRLQGHTGAVRSVAFTADGKTLISGSADGTVKLWDLGTGKERATLRGHTGAVRSVAITPDGRAAVSGGEDGTVKLWDTATGQERASYGGDAGIVRGVAVTPDGRTVVSGGDDGLVKLWDVDARKVRARLDGADGAVWCVAVTADGKTLAAAGAGKGVHLWDVATGVRGVTLPAPSPGITSLGFTADGGSLISGGVDGMARLWDVTQPLKKDGK